MYVLVLLVVLRDIQLAYYRLTRKTDQHQKSEEKFI